jgi:hypothetical protein
MPSKTQLRALAGLAALAVGAGACIDEPTFGKSSNTGGEVFLEGFGAGVNFQAFSGTDFKALGVDKTVAHSGQQSLKITVPAPDSTAGTYAGGAFTAGDPRDLSQFDALTFWAMASRPVTIDAAGFGNDNTGTSKYTAQSAAVPVTTAWTRVVLPIPDASKLTAEKGLFFFAASAKGTPATGYTLWLDDVRFEKLGSAALGPVTPAFDTGSSTLAVAQTSKVGGARITSSTDGVPRTLTMDNRYFAFESSAPSIASVAPDGTITGLAVGSATVTASLAGKAVPGAIVVNVAAPDPTVIALLSAKYPQHPVDTWLATWSMPSGSVAVSNAPDGGDPMETYSNLQYAGIEFFANVKTIDASASTTLHLDVKTSDPAEIHLKLVDFGANGVGDPPFDGSPHGDDSQGEIVLSPSSTPALVANGWVTYDLALTQFQVPISGSPGLNHRGHLSQLVLAGPSSGTPLVKTLSVKNVYFHQ